MFIFLSVTLTACALFLLVATLVFVVEVAAGCLLPSQEIEMTAAKCDRRVAVLIPAHNESAVIKPTIDDVKRQLRPGDRLLIVADNCNDETASIATASGAEVLVREDQTRIGKGYALDWGIKHLAAEPPNIVIVIDADCRVSEGSIEKLSQACAASGHPVQALYLMGAVAGSSVNHQVALFAWRVKNLVRPLGLHKLKLPCQLMGTGMAFPWNVIQSANLSNDFIDSQFTGALFERFRPVSDGVGDVVVHLECFRPRRVGVRIGLLILGRFGQHVDRAVEILECKIALSHPRIDHPTTPKYPAAPTVLGRQITLHIAIHLEQPFKYLQRTVELSERSGMVAFLDVYEGKLAVASTISRG